MARLAQYRDALLALLPKGQAWPTEPESELGKLMQGMAEEFTRIDARSQELLNESHPSQTFELFAEWEQQYGLPDSCAGDPQSFQERRLALLQKYRLYGGQSREFFIALAAALGYAVGITEYRERTFGMDYGTEYAGPEWNWVWQVDAALNNDVERSLGEPFGEFYRQWGNQRLECVLVRLVHAHRHLIFSYS